MKASKSALPHPPAPDFQGAKGRPLRTCMGTGQIKPQEELLRFSVVKGHLMPDPQRRLPGRGVYCTPRPEIYQKAIINQKFKRKLKLSNPLPSWAEILAQLPPEFILPNP